jgi:hypothetical protein
VAKPSLTFQIRLGPSQGPLHHTPHPTSTSTSTSTTTSTTTTTTPKTAPDTQSTSTQKFLKMLADRHSSGSRSPTRRTTLGEKITALGAKLSRTLSHADERSEEGEYGGESVEKGRYSMESASTVAAPPVSCESSIFHFRFSFFRGLGCVPVWLEMRRRWAWAGGEGGDGGGCGIRGTRGDKR